MGSRVTSIRLSEEELNRLKELAKERGIDFNTLVKEALRQYTGAQHRSQLPQYIEDLLSQFKERVREYVEEVKRFCEEHARIITNHDQEKERYNYWRDLCLHRYRRLTRNNLNVYIQDVLMKRINIHKLSADERVELQRRLNEIVENAVKEIYASPFPPSYL